MICQNTTKQSSVSRPFEPTENTIATGKLDSSAYWRIPHSSYSWHSPPPLSPTRQARSPQVPRCGKMTQQILSTTEQYHPTPPQPHQRRKTICQHAFDEAKALATSASCLAHYNVNAPVCHLSRYVCVSTAAARKALQHQSL